MLKDPYSRLMEMSKNAYERDMKFLDFFFAHSDKLITWLIGFAVAGISLIIANLAFFTNINLANVRFIVLLLSLTIIFGLLYRLTAYFYLIKNKNLEHYFSGYFYSHEMNSVVASDISNATFEEMKDLIKFEFGKAPSDYNTINQQLDLESIKKYYLALVEFSKKQFYIAANSLSELYESAYKIDKDESLNLFEMAVGLKKGKVRDIGFHAKRWSKITTIFFSASIISFLICIIFVCILFLVLKKF